jgi:hypothetical protein
VPAIVVRDASPKLLVNVNVPFPPTANFNTVIDPVGTTSVLVNVHVVVVPATTVMAAGVPFVQVAPV